MDHEPRSLPGATWELLLRSDRFQAQGEQSFLAGYGRSTCLKGVTLGTVACIIDLICDNISGSNFPNQCSKYLDSMNIKGVEYHISSMPVCVIVLQLYLHDIYTYI